MQSSDCERRIALYWKALAWLILFGCVLPFYATSLPAASSRSEVGSSGIGPDVADRTSVVGPANTEAGIVGALVAGPDEADPRADTRNEELPDAPQPIAPPLSVDAPQLADALPQSAQAAQAAPAAKDAGKSSGQKATPTAKKTEPRCTQKPCPLKTEAIDWYKRFMNGPEVKPLTPREKAHLAAKNIIDPFNALTILAQSAFYVGFNANSPYGPGMPGFGRNVGVSYSQDITSEFFNVFLIPSIMHQDPHYHRMPGASYKRRFIHATTQIFWTLGDNGRGMLNYANLVGSGVDISIGNLYVPGQQTHLTAALSEYFVGLATAPIDNYITEFLPDIARHIHIQIVLVQDIINQVARTSPPAE